MAGFDDLNELPPIEAHNGLRADFENQRANRAQAVNHIIGLNQLRGNEPGTVNYLDKLDFNNIDVEYLKGKLNRYNDEWNVRLFELIDLAVAAYTQRNPVGGRKYRRRRSRKYRKHRLSRNPRKSIRRRRTARRSI